MASGVLYNYEGETIEVHARKEVILSAGTFNSAKLLMVSGIGPKEHLEKLKVTYFYNTLISQDVSVKTQIVRYLTLLFWEMSN